MDGVSIPVFRLGFPVSPVSTEASHASSGWSHEAQVLLASGILPLSQFSEESISSVWPTSGIVLGSVEKCKLQFRFQRRFQCRFQRGLLFRFWLRFQSRLQLRLKRRPQIPAQIPVQTAAQILAQNHRLGLYGHHIYHSNIPEVYLTEPYYARKSNDCYW